MTRSPGPSEGRSGSPRWLTPPTLLLIIGVVLAAVAATVAVAVVRHRSGNRSTATPGAATGATSASPSALPSVSPPAAASCIDTTVARLSLEERVGQLLMVGTPIADPTSISADVARYHLGGVFLAGRSSQSAAQLHQAIRSLQKTATDSTGIALQVALDQEGGLVQTLSGPDFPTIPSAVVQGGWSSQQLRDRTTDWAKRLAAAGVTMNLAPVADTVPAGTAASNPPIGALDRQYGSSPGAVAVDINAVVGATQGAGILATLKHFPGLGRVHANTDTSADAVDNTTTVDDPFLAPFAAGIKAGTGAVMISSASYPKLDSTSIAAFSSAVVTGLLRQRLGFTGVVISDDLGAAVAVQSVPVGERAVRFITAGGDVVLTVRSSDAGPMSSALIAAAKQSPTFAARVTDAARHVIAGKVRTGLVHC